MMMMVMMMVMMHDWGLHEDEAELNMIIDDTFPYLHTLSHLAFSHLLKLVAVIIRPVEFSDAVLAAAGGLPKSHMDKTFANEFGEALEMLREVRRCGKSRKSDEMWKAFLPCSGL